MPCLTPYFVKSQNVSVPCGKCPACRLSRAQGWIFRLVMEDERHSSALFVTLTYDAPPMSRNGFMTLCKRDLTLYFKSLRNEHVKKYGACPVIRYYAAGEYGSKSFRPHYHIILFGADSELVAPAWSSKAPGRGMVDIGTVTSSSIAYTCKYICKRATVPSHRRDDRQKEFSHMSKGLGDNYLTDAIRRYHSEDPSRNYVTELGGVKVPMPRYYRNAVFTDGDREYQRALIAELSQLKLEGGFQDYLVKYPHHTVEDYHRAVAASVKRRLLADFDTQQKNRSHL